MFEIGRPLAVTDPNNDSVIYLFLPVNKNNNFWFAVFLGFSLFFSRFFFTKFYLSINEKYGKFGLPSFKIPLLFRLN